MMASARAGGHFTAGDIYPYTAGQGPLAALMMPAWATEGGEAAMFSRFKDPTLRRRIVADMQRAMELASVGQGRLCSDPDPRAYDIAQKKGSPGSRLRLLERRAPLLRPSVRVEETCPNAARPLHWRRLRLRLTLRCRPPAPSWDLPARARPLCASARRLTWEKAGQETGLPPPLSDDRRGVLRREWRPTSGLRPKPAPVPVRPTAIRGGPRRARVLVNGRLALRGASPPGSGRARCCFAPPDADAPDADGAAPRFSRPLCSRATLGLPASPDRGLTAKDTRGAAARWCYGMQRRVALRRCPDSRPRPVRAHWVVGLLPRRGFVLTRDRVRWIRARLPRAPRNESARCPQADAAARRAPAPPSFSGSASRLRLQAVVIGGGYLPAASWSVFFPAPPGAAGLFLTMAVCSAIAHHLRLCARHQQPGYRRFFRPCRPLLVAFEISTCSDPADPRHFEPRRRDRPSSFWPAPIVGISC